MLKQNRGLLEREGATIKKMKIIESFKSLITWILEILGFNHSGIHYGWVEMTPTAAKNARRFFGSPKKYQGYIYYAHADVGIGWETHKAPFEDVTSFIKNAKSPLCLNIGVNDIHLQANGALLVYTMANVAYLGDDWFAFKSDKAHCQRIVFFRRDDCGFYY